MQDSWSLVQDGFDLETCRYFEALLAIGSGPLHQRAVLEEGLTGDPQDLAAPTTAAPRAPFRSRAGTFMPAVTAPHPTLGEELVNLPMIHGLILFCGSERLDVTVSAVHEHRRRLDLRTGRLVRSFVWETRAGAVLRVTSERFISAARRHVMALRCTIAHVSGPSVELRVLASLDARVRTNGFDHFTHVEATGEHEPITLAVRTNSNVDVGAAALLTASQSIAWSADAESRWAALSGSATLYPGGRLTMAKFASLTSSRHVVGSPVDAARKLAWDAAAAGFDRLAAESDAVWAERWADADLQLEGDAESQLALRAAIYHLLRAANEDDPRVGIDPSGWTSESTGGRVTWEQDVFLLPPLLYARPKAGAALARFRLATLDGARRNAQREDYPGARYAWESTITGDEASPAAHARDHAVHVSADVAFGLWHVCLAVPDDLAMLRDATRALTEIARYWCERVTYEPERGEYELLMVMGPDQYKPFSRNNAYSAQMVRFALAAAGAAWARLRERAPEAAAQLHHALALGDDELTTIADVATRLRLPIDQRHGVLKQSDDFFDYEPLALDQIWPDRTQPLSSRIRLERLYRSQIVQQADAVLALALFPDSFAPGLCAATFDAYEPRTAHELTPSHAVHALVAARLGRSAEAMQQWRRAIETFLRPSGDALRLACGAALWQAAVFGFGGMPMRTQSETLTLKPRLPRSWRAMRFRVHWHGAPVAIQVTPDGVERR